MFLRSRSAAQPGKAVNVSTYEDLRFAASDFCGVETFDLSYVTSGGVDVEISDFGVFRAMLESRDVVRDNEGVAIVVVSQRSQGWIVRCTCVLV